MWNFFSAQWTIFELKGAGWSQLLPDIQRGMGDVIVWVCQGLSSPHYTVYVLALPQPEKNKSELNLRMKSQRHDHVCNLRKRLRQRVTELHKQSLKWTQKEAGTWLIYTDLLMLVWSMVWSNGWSISSLDQWPVKSSLFSIFTLIKTHNEELLQASDVINQMSSPS